MRRNNERTFILTEDHIKLLSEAYIGWDDSEVGAPAIDSKRPYGNGGVTYDIAKKLGWPKDHPEDDEWSETQLNCAWKIHEETQTALQIILCTKSFQPGTYYKTEEFNYRSWVLHEPKK